MFIEERINKNGTPQYYARRNNRLVRASRHVVRRAINVGMPVIIKKTFIDESITNEEAVMKARAALGARS